MDADGARQVAQRRHVKRANGLVRSALRELAAAVDGDVVATARVTSPQLAADAARMVEIAFHEASGPVDVIVTTAPTNHHGPAANGAKGDQHGVRR